MCLLVNGAQFLCGARADLTTRRGENGLSKPDRCPGSRFVAVHTGDRDRNGYDPCGQGSVRRVIDRSERVRLQKITRSIQTPSA